MTDRAKYLVLSIAVVSFVAVAVSTYLTWTSFQSEGVVGCGADSVVDCDEVLSSRWSQWFGVPVSLFGTLTYLGILTACWPAGRSGSNLWRTVLLTLALMAVGSAAWFVGLQLLVVKSLCLYCMVIHTCGLIVGVLALLLLREGSSESNYDQMRSLLGVADAPDTSDGTAEIEASSPRQPLVAVAMASLALVVLMVGQFLYAPSTLVMDTGELPGVGKETSNASSATDENADKSDSGDPEELSFETSGKLGQEEENQEDAEGEGEGISLHRTDTDGSPSEGSRLVEFFGLRDPLDLADFPILGNPDAEHVILEMMDYTCKHCRRMHPYVHKALDRYGDQLAFAICLAPLSKKCNPKIEKANAHHFFACDYAEMALCVWKVRPTKFDSFHEWLMDTADPPSVVSVRERALRVGGDRVIVDEGLRSEVGTLLAEQGAAFVRMKSGLPLLLTSKGVIKGVPEDDEKWYEFLENALGLVPVEP